MFQRILRFIREVISKMIKQTDIKTALRVEPAVSSEMSTALENWRLMYINKASWINDDVRPLSLPSAIASEIARSTTIEMKVEVSGSPRAKFLQQQLDQVLPMLREKIEYGAALGGMVMKPYISGGRVIVDFVAADSFVPVSFDGSGRMTAVVFVDQRQVGQDYYTRLEYHTLNGSEYTVQNLAYKSSTRDQLGMAIGLDRVQDWADLSPATTIANVRAPLFGYYRYPMANHIDPKSPLGVSCYARAADLIRDADEIYYTLVWEFESGRRAIYVDETAFEKDPDTGKLIVRDRRLYRSAGMIGGDIGEGKLFEEWSPAFREASIISGLDAVLKRIEFMCGLAYGSISDPQSVDKTATEIQASRQRSAATVVDNQKALRRSLDDLLYAIDVLTTLTPSLAQAAGRGAFEATYDFDDSLVVDRDAQRLQDRQDVTLGAMPLYRYLMNTRGLSEAEARAWIAEAQAEKQTQEPTFSET